MGFDFDWSSGFGEENGGRRTTDERTPNNGYTISSIGELTAQVSLQ